jgi:hypothetical protein
MPITIGSTLVFEERGISVYSRGGGTEGTEEDEGSAGTVVTTTGCGGRGGGGTGGGDNFTAAGETTVAVTTGILHVFEYTFIVEILKLARGFFCITEDISFQDTMVAYLYLRFICFRFCHFY